MNYSVLPKGKETKLHWTKDEIIMFLKESRDKLFDENDELLYDGLIVCISFHGLKDHIVTSDYRLIHKTAIHYYFPSTIQN